MKKIAALVLILFIGIWMVGCTGTEDADIIGEVNGMKISRAEYEQRCSLLQASYEMQQRAAEGLSEDEEIEIPEDVAAQLQDRAFDDMVYLKLMVKEAEDKGIEVNKEELDEAVNEFKQMQSRMGEDGYEKFLNQTGLDEEELRNEMKMDQIISKIQAEVTADVKVSEEEIRNYYDENIETFKQPAGIRIYHILVDSEELANDLLEKLNGGEDFSQLAMENSTCGSAPNGGDLGIVNETTNFVQEFKDAALKLEPGEITQTPVKTKFGYHIIKAGDRQEESIKAFEDVKNSLMLQLQQEKENQTFTDFIEGLHTQADVSDYRDN